MEINSGCSKCGSTSIHACTGEPAREWTPEEREGVREAFRKIAEREKAEKFKFQKFSLIDAQREGE